MKFDELHALVPYEHEGNVHENSMQVYPDVRVKYALVTFCECGCGGRRCTYCGVVGETTECATCAAVGQEQGTQ